MSTLPQTLAIVLAGGQGSRLHELTAETCKPAIPFAGEHRIIDWTMANLARAQVDRVKVALQYRPKELRRHLTKRWRPVLHRTGLDQVFGPDLCPAGVGFRGTADAVRQILLDPETRGYDEILILSADHIYEMDYDAMLSAHRTSAAGVSVAYDRVPVAEARSFGILGAGTDGRVTAFVEKPRTPPVISGDDGMARASMGIYVFSANWLRAAFVAADPEDVLSLDFGHDILPMAVATGDLMAFAAGTGTEKPFYWRDVGTLDAYRAAQVEFALDQPCGLPDARMPRPAQPWGDVRGNVRMPGAMVARGARLTNTIAAPGVAIAEGMVIGEDADEDRKWFRVTDGGTTLVTAGMVARRTEARSRQYWLRQMRAPRRETAGGRSQAARNFFR
ncbi:MAG: sugar phosphate nucleotidyltransferase [Pseudomonadota bacterium]